MDIELITKAALCTVGTVQMLKNFTKNTKIPGWIYVIITMAVGAAYTLLPLNDKVFNCILVVSGSTLFYDTIVKSFEKLFIKKSDSDSKSEQ